MLMLPARNLLRIIKDLEDGLLTSLISINAFFERRRLEIERKKSDSTYLSDENSLISVNIATYNRADLLVNRTLPSVLNQTYQNFEVVIVGDHCTDNTAERIDAINDPRIKFINLPQRGDYPLRADRRWMVAGTTPMNRAMHESRGLWIAHLDDDDCYKSDHLERMLRFAQKRDMEMVYSQMNKEIGINQWVTLGVHPPVARRRQTGVVPHSTAFFRSYLRLFNLDVNSWRYGMAADKHLWLRMELAGVRIGFLDQITVESPLRPGTTKSNDLAEDRC